MAGAIDVDGNTPNGVAEYNVWVDPLAAKEVIEGMPVTLVPLDATDDVPFTTFFVDSLARARREPRRRGRRNGSSRRTSPSSPVPGTPSGTRSRPRWCSGRTSATWDETPVVGDRVAGCRRRLDRSMGPRRRRAVRARGPRPARFRTRVPVGAHGGVGQVGSAPTPTSPSRSTVSDARSGLGTWTPVTWSSPIPIPGNRSKRWPSWSGLSDAFTYQRLRAFLGRDASILPPGTQPPHGLTIVAYIEAGLTEATVSPSVMAAVCASGGDEDTPPRVWLSPPVEGHASAVSRLERSISAAQASIRPT